MIASKGCREECRERSRAGGITFASRAFLGEILAEDCQHTENTQRPKSELLRKPRVTRLGRGPPCDALASKACYLAYLGPCGSLWPSLCYLAHVCPCGLLFVIWHMWVSVGPCRFLVVFAPLASSCMVCRKAVRRQYISQPSVRQ